jgi:diketogulonate reductase-like aldo/keto reductase
MKRRVFLAHLASGFAGPAVLSLAPPTFGQSQVLTRPIPNTQDRLPAVGLGTWLTFHAEENHVARTNLLPVLQTFFDLGGRLIDSSPMYGSAEDVLGELLPQVRGLKPLFAATKVWTQGESNGIGQMEQSRKLWRVPRFDLMMVHNMMDWRTHLKTLQRMKEEGRVRYIGITTSHGRRHEELEQVIRTQPFDFVQFTYNLADRDAEPRLLPAALDKGKVVIINRPFDGGALFRNVTGFPLPGFAKEIGCANWAQFFLKWIVSHPAVTCAIPATSQVGHMRENMGALQGALPDAGMRKRMQEYFARF